MDVVRALRPHPRAPRRVRGKVPPSPGRTPRRSRSAGPHGRRLFHLPRTVLTLAALLAALAVAATPAVRAQEGPARLTGIQLRKEGERLRLQFELSHPVPTEVVSNLPKRVLVVKFKGALPAFAEGRRQFAYNDPYVVGIAFEQTGEDETWAKVRLRTPQLAYQLTPQGPDGAAELALEPARVPTTTQLADLRLGRQEGASRLVLDLTAVPPFSDETRGDEYLVRLEGVTPALASPQRPEDDRVAVMGVERDGADTLLRVRMKQPQTRVNVFSLPSPARLVFDFRAARPQAAATASAEAPAGQPAQPLRQPQAESLEVLLDNEDDPLVRSNYILAERAFRAGNYAQAAAVFRRVYDNAPQKVLGVRALFRSADAAYEAQQESGAEAGYHEVIVTYQSAIRAAEELNYESSLIPRAFFQIGRSYQRMGFHFESNVHYDILQERFPDNFPYTPDSYYYEGLNNLDMRNNEAAVAALRTFFQSDGDPALRPEAHYRLGDALFSLERYVEARGEFQQARRLDEDYALQHPLLLFHMAETYYETADFQQARALYRVLLERYPDKDYTKLVALRLGDFLRDEGKQADALRVYQSVVEAAPLPLQLRARMRIAGIYGERPQGDDYQRAVALYDEVIGEADADPNVVQEAMLRKALVLTLHGRHQAAIDQFEQLAEQYPDGPYTRKNLVGDNIDENLKSRVNELFAAGKHWEIAKIYTKYRDAYFPNFPFPRTLFEVGYAYQQLGLYDEAIGLYDEVLREDGGTVASLIDYQRARAQLEKDDLNAAETSLLRFIQDHDADPYLTDARMLLGQVYLTARRYEDARNAYRIVIRHFEESRDPALVEAVPEAWYHIGQIDKELGQHQDALEAFQAAVRTFNHPIQGPEVPDFIRESHFLAGDMLFELGRDAAAVDAYEQAIGLYPDSERAPWARYQIGLVYRRTGQDQKALDTFNALVQRAETQPGELWEPLARENQRELANKLNYQDYLKR